MRFALFLAVSLGLHALALGLMPRDLMGGPANAGAGDAAALAGASAEIAALVEAWETPPETGEAGEIATPQIAPPADISAAERALAAVEAGAATEALAETDDPGPTPDRPVMAALPRPKTTAPAGLSPRMPGSPSVRAVADSGFDSPVSPGSSGFGGMAALSPGLAAPSRPAAPPPEDSMAPARAPLPAPRGTRHRDDIEEAEESAPAPAAPAAPVAEPPMPPEATSPRAESSGRIAGMPRPASTTAPGPSSDTTAAPSAHDGVADGQERGAKGSDTLRAAYGARIRAAIDANKRYPSSARLRGDEGVAVLLLSVERSGRLAGAELRRTSGRAPLDAAALDAAHAVERYPEAPAALAGAAFDFVVPVAFRID